MPAPTIAPALRWFHTAPANAEPATMINAAMNCARNGSRPKAIRVVTRFSITVALKSSTPKRSETSNGNRTWNSKGPYCGRYFFREEGRDTFMPAHPLKGGSSSQGRRRIPGLAVRRLERGESKSCLGHDVIARFDGQLANTIQVNVQ